MKRPQAASFLVFLLPLLAGCSMQLDVLASKSDFDKNAPVVYVHPLSELDRQSLSIGILSFQVPPNVSPLKGTAVAGLMRDVLLGKQTFHAVKLIEKGYSSNEEAVAIGRDHAVDLVLAGRVNYFLNGYELGGDRVDLSVRLLDVQSGNTVWYLQQTADKAVSYPDKSFGHKLTTVFSAPEVRSQVGRPAAINMVVRIAEDMSDVVAGAKSVSKY